MVQLNSLANMNDSHEIRLAKNRIGYFIIFLQIKYNANEINLRLVL